MHAYRLVLALALMCSALAVRAALDPWLGGKAALSLMYAAVALTSWLAGLIPAVLVMGLGGVLGNALFVTPRGGAGYTDPQEIIADLLYAVSCCVIIAAGVTIRRFHHRTESLRRHGEVQRARLEREIADRERAQHALEAKESQLRQITDAIPALISYVDRDARYQLNNKAYEVWFGHPRAQITGRAMADVLGDEAWVVIAPYIARALQGEAVSYERHVNYRDAGERWIRAQYVPHVAATGEVLGVVVLVDDVSAMKSAEAALRQSLEELQTLFEAAPVGIWVAHDAACARVTGNGYANQLLGVAPGTNVTRDAEGLRPHRIRVERDGRPVAAQELPLQQALARGRPVLGQQLELTVRDRPTIHLFGNAAPLFDEAGKVRGAISVMVDVTEQKRADAALKQADRRKDEFLATLAHELRNPLAPIRTAVHVLSAPDASEDDARRALAMIDRQVQQMVRLIDDLLDVSRITSGKMRLRMERVDLADVARAAVDTSRPLIAAGGHQLTVSLPDQPCHVHADATRLAQVFANLLNNAAKYTDPGGHIRLTLQRDGEHAIVRVQDSGIGIAPEQRARIFEMFSQVAPALERSQGGLGIGLSLARGLVHMHGGSIEAASAGIGKGSEFLVRLPVVHGAAPPSASASPEPSAPVFNRRVLVVDDNLDACNSLTTLLDLSGYETRAAHDGPQAVGEAQAFRPDAIVMDIGLPRMNGYDAARAIRREDRKVRLIALTGWGEDEARRRALEAGFDHHLTKPVDPPMLLRLLADSA